MKRARAGALARQVAPAAVVGVGSALALAALSVLSDRLQDVLWEHLPDAIGIDGDGATWTILVLSVVGLVVGLLVWRVPGHAGPDPATQSLVSPPQPPTVLPGLAIVVIIGLAGGVSLGPENPIVAINVGLAVWLGRRATASTAVPQWVGYAAAGTIGAMFATPVGAALVLTEMPSDLVLLWAFPLLHRAFHLLRHPVAMLTVGGVALGVLGAVGGRITMFKGLDEMKRLVLEHDDAGRLTVIVVVKSVALLVAATCGFRGGRIFPAVFIGVAFGLLAHQVVDAVPVSLAVSAAVLGIMLVVSRSGWLSLFMAVTIVAQIDLLPMLCVALLPAWLLVTDRPEMLLEPEPVPAGHPTRP